MSYILFLIILIALAAAVFVGVMFILKKTSIPITKARSGAFIGALILVLAFHGMTPRFYLVTGTPGVLQVEELVAFWGTSYTTASGKELSFGITTGHCGVINDSEVDIVVEPILYGAVNDEFYFPNFVEKENYTTCKTPRIDLMPHETPNETIEVRDSRDGEVVYWIHEYFEGDFIYDVE